MGIDVRTIIIILGISHIMQVLVFYHQFRVNKTYKGIGWWLLWSAAEVLGFGAMLLRNIPTLLPLAIIIQNIMIVGGTAFIYFGVRKFFGKSLNLKLIIPILSLFAIGLLYFLFIYNDIQVRSAFISAVLAIISLLTAYILFEDKTPNIKATRNFNALIFLIHGGLFVYRFVMICYGAQVSNIFAPTLFNILPYFDALIVSLLWTFGFIIMLNQRLNFDMSKAKDDLQLIFNTSPDAALITGYTGIIYNVNEGYTAISGYSREEVLGKSIIDVNIWKNLEDRQKVLRLIKDKGFVENFESQFIMKDGSEITGLMSAKLINLHGEQNIISITRDISERKRVEESLRETNEYLQNLFDYANAPIIVWDKVFKITRFNHAFEDLSGYSESEVIGKPVEILFPKSKIKFSLELIKNSSYGTRWETVEIEILRKDGEIRFVLWNSANIFNKTKSEIIATIAQGNDITERKQKEEQVEKLLKESERSHYNLLSILEDQMQTEDDLRLLTLRQEALLFATPEIIMEVDNNKIYQWANKQGLEFFGKDVIGKYAANYFEGEQETFNIVQPLFIGHENLIYVESWQKRKDGEKRLLAWYCSSLRNQNGEIIGALSSARDITDQKLAEEKLKENHALLRIAEEKAHLGGWSVILEENRSYWSDEVAAIHEMPAGYSPLVEDGINFYAPEWRDRITKVFTDCAQEGIPYDEEMQIITSTGKRVWVHTIGEAVRNEKGEIFKVHGAFQDINERKKAEDSLKESEEKFKTMVETIPLAIHLTTGIEQITQYINPFMVNLFGYTAEDIPSVKEWWPLAYPDEIYRQQTADEWNSKVQKAIETQSPIEPMEVVVTCRDGSKKNILWGFITLGENNYSFGLDLTERKKAEDEILLLNAELEQRVIQRTEQLEIANKELEAFSYSVSHDLRAPLRHINGYVDLLLRRYHEVLSEKGQHYLDTIASSANQMGTLIDDLLDFSRTGRQELQYNELDMNRVLDEALELIKPSIHNRNFEWLIGNLPSAVCDHSMLRLVWTNLLSNAVKFTRPREKAVIEIDSYVENDEIVFLVRDNGVGFDMQYSNKLFGVFQRLHPVEDFEGTGIGLANVRRIIIKHGGRTWADSTLDKGATFYFTIPKYKE